MDSLTFGSSIRTALCRSLTIEKRPSQCIRALNPAGCIAGSFDNSLEFKVLYTLIVKDLTFNEWNNTIDYSNAFKEAIANRILTCAPAIFIHKGELFSFLYQLS